jgi:hypothetical protein
MGDSNEPIVPDVLPRDPNKETLAHSLNITPQREQKLIWLLDEIVRDGGRKDVGIRKIAAFEGTSEEKAYLGYMLCKRFVIMKTPSPARAAIMKMLQL